MSFAAIPDMPVQAAFVQDYFTNLVNQFFKILPIRESGEESLPVYMRSLQIEMLGCQQLVPGLENSHVFVSLLAILQFLIEHPELPTQEVRREVFKAIRLCKKLDAASLAGQDKEVSAE